MLAGCVVSWVIIGIGFAQDALVEILLGMIAPLAITTATFVLVERAYKRDPQDVTAIMLRMFVAKMLVIGAYVTMVLGVLAVQTTPFIVSFSAYFLGLYFVEFLCLRHLMGVSAETTEI